jgi:hypothetical protein
MFTVFFTIERRSTTTVVFSSRHLGPARSFERMRHLQQPFFVEVLTKQLHPHGHGRLILAGLSHATGDRNAGHYGQVGGDSVNVG